MSSPATLTPSRPTSLTAPTADPALRPTPARPTVPRSAVPRSAPPRPSSPTAERLRPIPGFLYLYCPGTGLPTIAPPLADAGIAPTTTDHALPAASTAGAAQPADALSSEAYAAAAALLSATPERPAASAGGLHPAPTQPQAPAEWRRWLPPHPRMLTQAARVWLETVNGLRRPATLRGAFLSPEMVRTATAHHSDVLRGVRSHLGVRPSTALIDQVSTTGGTQVAMTFAGRVVMDQTLFALTGTVELLHFHGHRPHHKTQPVRSADVDLIEATLCCPEDTEWVVTEITLVRTGGSRAGGAARPTGSRSRS